MHVVVLGAGYAGLTLSRLLEDDLPEEVEITVVNESPDHLLQHELHRVIRRPDLADEITVSLPAVLERATVRVARVEEIDRDERVVTLTNGTLSYDVCAICLGARTARYGLEGVPERGIPLKRLHHANRIRRRTLEAFDDVRASSEPARLVVGGAGLSGIQIAGELAELADEEGVAASVTLLEQFEAVAPSFPANFQRSVRDALEDIGVDVRTGTTVARADEARVSLEEGDDLPYDVFVWAGGIRGPDALEGDRPTVEADLRLDQRTFAIGDAARIVDADGESVPPSAQAAVREARTAAKNIGRLVDAAAGSNPDDLELSASDPDLERFSFDSPGWLVSVGDDAVAQVGPSVFRGRAAKALKATVGVGYLSSVGATRNAVDLARVETDADSKIRRALGIGRRVEDRMRRRRE
ncbi:NAD(P)/FAD-dependent oxidoreductase [Natrialbaceae archaeon GCM10025810]|uniref:NAD(P)/FAD-dependent oxidoreductase n=1 Tax=Halovalidus salilacus TaxID=3075124 RepID=UPI00360999ED